VNLTSINERVENIKYNEAAINSFVEEYKPFISSCVQKATGKYVRFGEDDELSIGLMAFVEAIKSYESIKGNFLSFAQNIIKRRLIDYYRKEKKHNNVISLNGFYEEDGETEKDLSVGASIDNYSKEMAEESRKHELEELKIELHKWDISFLDLVDVSPKHDKTRKIYKEIIRFLIDQPVLLANIMKKKYLPIAEIEKSLNIPRKKIERARKYIIAVLLINTGDYQYIKEFIQI
jgi:RNA polymerase sigma factor